MACGLSNRQTKKYKFFHCLLDRPYAIFRATQIAVHFHLALFFYLVILPTIFLAFLAIFYAYLKLKKPVLELLKEYLCFSSKQKKYKKDRDTACSFLEDLKTNTLRNKKTLVFFMIFSSFCFSTMTQMAGSMDKLASFMMSVIVLLIGMILACTTLFLAITTVINGNTKTIAMMRAFGYSQKECCKALLGGYRPMAYIGFAVGTIYQYALIKMMVTVVFEDIANMPEYQFDFSAMFISLISFALLYEIVMYCYSERIKNISIKEIMLE